MCNIFLGTFFYLNLKLIIQLFQELFADIGVLLESRVVRPGVAEVIYERRADAIQAVDVYHNRQLDGRPMKCDMMRNTGSSSGPITSG